VHDHGPAARVADRGDAIRNEPEPRHQAGAAGRLLHPIARTTDIQIDLVIAEFGADSLRHDHFGIEKDAGRKTAAESTGSGGRSNPSWELRKVVA
jgi:hypothetical protein